MVKFCVLSVQHTGTRFIFHVLKSQGLKRTERDPQLPAYTRLMRGSISITENNYKHAHFRKGDMEIHAEKAIIPIRHPIESMKTHYKRNADHKHNEAVVVKGYVLENACNAWASLLRYGGDKHYVKVDNNYNELERYCILAEIFEYINRDYDPDTLLPIAQEWPKIRSVGKEVRVINEEEVRARLRNIDGMIEFCQDMGYDIS